MSRIGRRPRVPLVGRSLRVRLALTLVLAVVPLAAAGAVAIRHLHAAGAHARAAAAESHAVARLTDLLPRASDPAVTRRIGRLLAARAGFAPAVRYEADRLAAIWHRDPRDARRLDAALHDLRAAEEKQEARAAAAPASGDVTRLAAAVGAALLLATLAVWGLGAAVVRPLRRLRDSAALLGHERLGFRLPVDRRDEIGDLARSVNELADRLAAARTSLARGAQHDPVTLLPSASLLGQRVAEALDRARLSGRRPVLLWIGLDDFEAVRGSLGADSGDRLLKAVGERIAAVVRPTDTVARAASESFAVLLDGVHDVDEAAARAERVLETLRRRRNGDGREVIVRASIGIARAEAETPGSDGLLQAASIAMQAARAQGGDRVAIFTPEMRAEASDRLSLEADLRDAIERRQLSLVYQPLFDLGTGTICGLEALVRWAHPERGPISPGAFIPLAEQTGLIEPLGLFVLGEACGDALRLRARGARVPIGVNLSRRQLDLPHLVRDVRRILGERRFDPSALVLEITESAVAANDGSAIERLVELRSLGIRIALDDFGIGYSSLGSLKTLPIDIVKLDRSFVSDLRADDPASLESVKAVVDLGHALGLRAVAEGIEEPEQLEVLRRLGCDEGQGFHLGKPMELGRIGRLLADAPRQHAAVS